MHNPRRLLILPLSRVEMASAHCRSAAAPAAPCAKVCHASAFCCPSLGRCCGDGGRRRRGSGRSGAPGRPRDRAPSAPVFPPPSPSCARMARNGVVRQRASAIPMPASGAAPHSALEEPRDANGAGRCHLQRVPTRCSFSLRESLTSGATLLPLFRRRLPSAAALGALYMPGTGQRRAKRRTKDRTALCKAKQC